MNIIKLHKSCSVLVICLTILDKQFQQQIFISKSILNIYPPPLPLPFYFSDIPVEINTIATDK